MPKIRSTVVVMVAALALTVPAVSAAQEHPEHPEEGDATGPALTEAALASAIESYVESVASRQGGTYPLEDPETGKTLELTLERVHEERLARVGEDTYFACVDFSASDGTSYDVDFFMKGENADDLEYQDFSIHKVDGEPRYTWYEEGGVWKKKPVDEEGEHEHPEEGEKHPDEPPPR
jgi:hypothetical protein